MAVRRLALVALVAIIAAYRFALFVLTAEGQRILARHGFAVPSLPQ